MSGDVPKRDIPDFPDLLENCEQSRPSLLRNGILREKDSLGLTGTIGPNVHISVPIGIKQDRNTEKGRNGHSGGRGGALVERHVLSLYGEKVKVNRK